MEELIPEFRIKGLRLSPPGEQCEWTAYYHDDMVHYPLIDVYLLPGQEIYMYYLCWLIDWTLYKGVCEDRRIVYRIVDNSDADNMWIYDANILTQESAADRMIKCLERLYIYI